MCGKLYALLLEDVPKDAELLREMLADEGFDLRVDIVDTEQAYISCLKNHDYDIIYADFTLPAFNGQEALELAKIICPYVPFICISGTIGEDRAVELLKQGATDYVLKDRMERLPFATKRALDAAAQLSKFRQTEIELQTNRRLLQTIINNATDVIYIKDLNCNYILVNEAAEKAIGKTSAEVIGKNDTFFFSASEAETMIEMDKKVIAGGVPKTIEETITLADGTTHIFSTIKSPMFDDFGKITGLFGIARDITERKQMEDKLIEAKEKAEESDNLKTAFLHNISHEIRTPLNAIVGFSGLLSDPETDAEKRKHFIDIILQSSDQLLLIIADIVDIATIEAGQVKIIEKEIELNSMLKLLFDQFLLKANKQNITLALNSFLPDTEIRIIADETKLSQILSNLISNALKFTKQGNVNFGYQIKEDEIEFVVEDTGIGIPATMHNEIFKRFRQVESTTARQFGGSGLGLSISKAYVEMLGGKIWLDSDLGKGSTFYFTIPYKRAQKTVSSDKSITGSGNRIKQQKTLLVAEDEDSNFMLLEELLSGLNSNILRAVNGLEAVEICKSNRQIDLVLMDIKMPVMDGYEATRQIRNFLPVLPIIAQTAYTSEVDRNKALVCGCNDFISKPFKRDSLISKVNNLLYLE
ncbi:MAG: response regulator [Draconibacterium sp.]